MSLSEFDSYRPPEESRRQRRRGGKRRRAAGSGNQRGGDGAREMSMVPEPEFSSYYGRPIVKAPPWKWEIGAYLFLGGLAGGSSILALGAQLTGRDVLRRNARFSAITAAGLGTLALLSDLGRPERFLNMMRTFKVTSPMSVGSWLLAAYATNAGGVMAAELDRVTGEVLPLGPLRPVLRFVEAPLGVTSAVLGAPLAAYTAVLLGATAVPTWNAMHEDLSFVFVSSASMASGGLAMITTPVREAGPARSFAVMGVAGDLIAMHLMKHRMDPVSVEPLEQGKPGTWLTWSERLAVAGGVGTLLGGRNRAVAAASGLALMASSLLTRFGVFNAGKESVKNPRYVIEPQRTRLAKRRAAGQVGDSITTVG